MMFKVSSLASRAFLVRCDRLTADIAQKCRVRPACSSLVPYSQGLFNTDRAAMQSADSRQWNLGTSVE